MTDVKSHFRGRVGEAPPAYIKSRVLTVADEAAAAAQAEAECLEELDDMAGENVRPLLLLVVYGALFAMIVVGVIVLRSLGTAS